LSTIKLPGHVIAEAYLVLAYWRLGGQFDISPRGAERLPVALLPIHVHSLSQTQADGSFVNASHREIYYYFSGTVKEYLHSGRAAMVDISAGNLPLNDACAFLKTPCDRAALCHDHYVVLPSLNAEADLAYSAVLKSLETIFDIIIDDDAELYKNSIAAVISEVFGVSRGPAPTQVTR